MSTRDDYRVVPTRQRVGGRVHPLPRGNAAGRVLLLVTTALVIFGTIFVASASEGQSAANGGSAFSIMVHDVAYLCLGVFALYGASRVRLERLVKSAPLLISVGFGLLLAVKAVGVSANGGKRWLDLRVIDLQPCELFKLCCVLFIAWLVQHHHDELNHWVNSPCGPLPVSLGCGLIVLEPDIGTATVVLVIVLAMLAVAGLSRRLLCSVVGPRVCGRRVPTRRAVLGEALLLLSASQHQPVGKRLSTPPVQDRSRRRGLTGLGLGH